jgi:ABC-type sugar transport system permease subunit
MESCKTHKSKLLFILLLLFLCFPGAMAQTISFADPDTTTHRDVQMYGYNNTSGQWGLLASYNTTSTGITLPDNTDVQFVLKPQYTSPMDDPGTWLSSAFSFIQTNLIAILVSMFLIGLLLARR